VLQRLVRIYPGQLDIDWKEMADESLLTDALSLTVEPAEDRGLEDDSISLQDWLRRCAREDRLTDLEVAIQLFEGTSLDPLQQEHVFETCDVPVAYHLREPGSGRCEIGMMPEHVSFQKKPIPRERFSLAPKIVRPLERCRTLRPHDGRRAIELSLAALCSRNLEIYPLIYANPGDVTVVDCRRGLQVVLAGMQPEFRSVPESLLFFLILKNGVPIAYGPASIFLGCCEMGINLFPEFRAGEIRYIYAQFMRALYHLAHVRYFFITSYGMGVGNPQALKSGAFWFYRKMGFKASNPDVEALAREEEETMMRSPGYRCSMRTLRRLSPTEAYFDLSAGRVRPIDFGRLGLAASRHITERYGGIRSRARAGCARTLVRRLGIGDYASWRSGEKMAMRQLAPVLDTFPHLERWPQRDKTFLAAVIKAKGASSEFGYMRRLGGSARLARVFQAIS
jgi:hypothetical protein